MREPLSFCQLIGHASHFLKAPSHRLMGMDQLEYSSIRDGHKPLTFTHMVNAAENISDRVHWLSTRPQIVPPMILAATTTYIKEELKRLMKQDPEWGMR